MTPEHAMLREALGAYALGQLDEPELAAAVELHLTTCESCREDLEDMAPAASALSDFRSGSREATLEPPRALDERMHVVLKGLERRRRGWVPATAGLLAGAVAATVVSVVVLRDEPDAGPVVIAVPDVDATRGVDASVGLVDHTWGLELKLTATGLPAGETYDVQVLGRDGESYDAGEFIGVNDKTITCDMSASVLFADATAFTVKSTDGRAVIWGDLPS